MTYKKLLIISDIEGSSACLDRASAKFFGKGWPRACLGMTRDVNAVATALLDAGVARVHIRDFHRTAYNIIPSLIHPGAVLHQGYAAGPVPGMGAPEGFDGVVMIGMHAPSGSRGFLSHTLTSRIAGVTVHGQLISEAQLFSAALASFGIPPLFFSGCPEACTHTRKFMSDVHTFPIDKFKEGFHAPSWRQCLAEETVKSLRREQPVTYNPEGPFRAVVTMAEGRQAAKTLEQRWGYRRKGRELHLEVKDFAGLFRELSRLAFLTPLGEKLVPLALPLYHLMGRAGLAWAQKKPLYPDEPSDTGAETE
ncbi:MAG: M55 family metallopeptidase [Desulfobacterales bacterium]|nr:M55 family metallopeptidase [Desulfobacterales bacterium]